MFLTPGKASSSQASDQTGFKMETFAVLMECSSITSTNSHIVHQSGDVLGVYQPAVGD